jgi:hypothetical protein
MATSGAVSLGLVYWGRQVAKRHPSPAWRYASWMPIVALGLAALQYATTAYLIVRAFDRVATTVPPDEKARFLAEGISEAMNVGALFGIPSGLLYVGSLVAFTVGSIVRPRRNA